MKKKVRKTLWREWGELPEFMRNEEVKPYYEALNRRRGSIAVKRTFDFAMSSVMLAALSPVFAALALMIKLDSKGPVFYRQERVTQYGRVFKIYKFRTMVQDADKIGSLVTTSGDERITRVGKRLRGCRLDELPQLINIWKGEMSFVGTRPEVVKYVKQYTREMYATLLLPAGVTSEASVMFKDEDEMIAEGVKEGLSVDEVYVERVLPEKMKGNLDGVRRFSVWGELLVMVKTLKVAAGR
ncbi:bacterial sugar transferase [Clostridium sp. CAG:149]|nr:bacterial sugar transferase [Clostridium sp. CAG:149]